MAAETRSGGFPVEFQPTSPDERERMMQFLLNQQAQFDANQAKFDSALYALSAKTDRIADGLIGLTGIVGRLAAAQERTDAQFREADARLQAHIDDVDSHLNLVIEMFERHLREDHGQRPS